MVRRAAAIEPIVSDEWMMRLRWLVAAVFVAVYAFYVVMTRRWNVTGDTAEMHYIVFLMSRGKLPYSQITDMNMPGTYLCERLGMAVFGWGDLGWRLYEFFLMLVLTGAGVVIAGRRRWIGGLLAGMFFIAMHGADGPYVSAERDEIITILTAVALAALVLAVRRRMPSLALLFGMPIGLALAIKPTVLLVDAALLTLLGIVLWKRQTRVMPYLLWGIAGQVIVGLVVLGYLMHYHALAGLLFILRKVLPAYAASNKLGLGSLLETLLPAGLLLPLLLACAAAALRNRRMEKERMEWEQWALLLCAAAGAFSYIVQGKGYVHHRYEFAFFLVLWIGVELSEVLRRTDPWLRLCGVTGILLLLLALPHYVRVMLRDSRGLHRVSSSGLADIQPAVSLDRYLSKLGGDQLQGRVVCLEMLEGCLNGLYRMRLVENTSSTGDMLLFPLVETPLARYYQNSFMQLQRQNPADVVVLGNEWFLNGKPDFRKVDAWPEYKKFLEDNYIEAVEWKASSAQDADRYKLYLRKGSKALVEATAHPLGPAPTGDMDGP